MAEATTSGVKWSDSDLVNPDDYCIDTYCKLYIVHDCGFTVAAVIADCLQNALDIIVDESDKLDGFQIHPEEFENYGTTAEEQWENMTTLGNASEPFDIETLQVVETALPEFSLAAMVNAQGVCNNG